jgi:hypothetical protein
MRAARPPQGARRPWPATARPATARAAPSGTARPRPLLLLAVLVLAAAAPRPCATQGLLKDPDSVVGADASYKTLQKFLERSRAWRAKLTSTATAAAAACKAKAGSLCAPSAEALVGEDAAVLELAVAPEVRCGSGLMREHNAWAGGVEVVVWRDLGPLLLWGPIMGAGAADA